MPSVALEAILAGLELKVVRIHELVYTFKYDFKLFVTNMTVFTSMLFTKPSNAIFIGLFVYLCFFARQFLKPLNEVLIYKASEFDEDEEVISLDIDNKRRKENSDQDNPIKKKCKLLKIIFFLF